MEIHLHVNTLGVVRFFAAFFPVGSGYEHTTLWAILFVDLCVTCMQINHGPFVILLVSIRFKRHGTHLSQITVVKSLRNGSSSIDMRICWDTQRTRPRPAQLRRISGKKKCRSPYDFVRLHCTTSGKSDAITSKHFERKLFISIMRIFATWIEKVWRYQIACGKLQSREEAQRGASGLSRGKSFDAITPFNLSKHMQRARAKSRQMKRANCALLCVCMTRPSLGIQRICNEVYDVLRLEGTISGKIESTNKGNKLNEWRALRRKAKVVMGEKINLSQYKPCVMSGRNRERERGTPRTHGCDKKP